MSSNIHQVYVANPSTTMLSTDLIYIGHSPYNTGDDSAITFANFLTQFPTQGVVNIIGDDGFVSGTSVYVATDELCGSSMFFAGSGTELFLQVTDKDNNTLIGQSCGNFNTPGSNNTGLGFEVLSDLEGGTNNTAAGYFALNSLGAGTHNCAFGVNSLSAIGGGLFNLGLGFSAGSAYAGSESSNILLNNLGTLGESHVLRIGAATGTGDQQLNKAFISGINGVTNTSPLLTTINSSTDQLGVISSVDNGVLITSNSGVPSLLANGTAGYVFTANSGAPPSWQATNLSGAILEAFSGVQHITEGSLQVDAGNLAVTGYVIAYPPVSSSGQLNLAPVTNTAGNFNTLISNAASVGQTQTVTIPDSGVATPKFILSSATATQSISALNIGSNPVAANIDGTFTPGLAFGGSSTGITYANQFGWYTQVGNTVTFSLRFLLTSIGSATGDATVTGLPVAARAVATNQNLLVSGNALTFTGYPIAAMTGNNTEASLFTSTSVTGNAAMTNSNFANDTELFVSGTYLV